MFALASLQIQTCSIELTICFLFFPWKYLLCVLALQLLRSIPTCLPCHPWTLAHLVWGTKVAQFKGAHRPLFFMILSSGGSSIVGLVTVTVVVTVTEVGRVSFGCCFSYLWGESFKSSVKVFSEDGKTSYMTFSTFLCILDIMA